MKILHYINNLGSGGAEKLLTDMLPLFKEKGHEVHLAYSNGEKNVSKYLSVMKQAGISVFDLNTSFYNPLQIIKLIRLLRKEKYDIIHAHTFPTQYWLALASFFKPKGSVLVKTEHSVYNERKGYKVLRPLEKFIYKRYHSIIGITEQVSENLAEWLGNSKNIVTINNGVNLRQIYNEREKIVLEDYSFFLESNYKILMVGRFDSDHQKDQASLVKAMSFLPLDCKLYFAGEGANLNKVESLVSELKLKDRVVFLGMRTDVYKLMNLVDLNVLSTNHEGLSGVALESMASGKPFIGTDAVGVNNIVPDNQFLFPKNNPTILAEKIKNIKDNIDVQNDLLYKAKKHIDQFDIVNMVEKYLNIYNKKDEPY